MRGLAALLAVAVVVPVAAQAQDRHEVAASAPIDRSVTIYRAPGRSGGAMTLSQLGGFAVITETRTVDLPAGAARLRFEGVADGIIAESAIVTGLPGGVVEKNRDDALLSPSALMRAFVGRSLTLQRTDEKTGKVTLTPARLVSASDQGVIFATDQGDEALRCSGLPEAFRFTGEADGLSAVPTLSIRMRSASRMHTLVKLTYITENFDWNANYIAHLGEDGRTLDLTGWITLANGNGVTLSDARTQIVAGGLNRAYMARFASGQPRVVAQCWPTQTTSDIPERAGRPYQLVHPLLEGDGDIGVSASARRVPLAAPMVVLAAPAAPPPPPPPPPTAEQLGDLKLYRVGERTTIAARQMKQTRLIDQRDVPFETYYRAEAWLSPWIASSTAQAVTQMLRMVNDKAHHLGLPLPSGSMLVQQDQGAQAMVLGEPPVRDTAEGETLDLAVGPANDITCQWSRTTPNSGSDPGTIMVTLTNGSPHDGAVELRLVASGGWVVDRTSAEAPKIDGVPTVKVTLASGEERQISIDLTRR